MDELKLRPAQLQALSAAIASGSDDALTDFLGALVSALASHPMDDGAHADAIYMLGVTLSDYGILQKIGASRLVANIGAVPSGTLDLLVEGLPVGFREQVQHELDIWRRVGKKVAREPEFSSMGKIAVSIVADKSPRISEQNQVVFNVAKGATKPEIKAAVEALFGVRVTAVNTLVRRGSIKRIRGILSENKNVKQAVVTLAEGQSIDVSNGI